MAKGQQRSNREKKKPKQQKAKPATGVSQFSIQQPRTTTGPTTGKNRRAKPEESALIRPVGHLSHPRLNPRTEEGIISTGFAFAAGSEAEWEKCGRQAG